MQTFELAAMKRERNETFANAEGKNHNIYKPTHTHTHTLHTLHKIYRENKPNRHRFNNSAKIGFLHLLFACNV